jgi:aspartate/tyrosine/aromatic aminotransferase
LILSITIKQSFIPLHGRPDRICCPGPFETPDRIAMTASTTSKTHRFADIQTAPPDAILGLTEAFLADKTPNKMNLSVGVYKDASGQTPVLRCVKAAERQLLETEKTKGYLPIDGLPDYREAVRKLVFGDLVDASRVAVLQSPGGTGALRIAAGFLASQLAPIRVWLPTPTWENHNAVFASEGLPIESYRYLSADRTSLDFEGLIEDLRTKTSLGDAVLLHACCHNPTGVDPTTQQWSEIAAVLAERQLLPVIDFAYQGFGNGLEQDTAAIAAMVGCCDEVIVCNSFSKNFGLYGERVGAMSLIAANQATAKAAQSQLKRVVRCNYSNPPRHGAAIVATVLSDALLTQQWHEELTEMRDRIKRLRQQFVETMKTTGKGHDFGFLLSQCGMFSFSGLNKMQVDQLRADHGIYIVGSGRINVAGMNEANMDQLCSAVANVIED